MPLHLTVMLLVYYKSYHYAQTRKSMRHEMDNLGWVEILLAVCPSCACHRDVT